VVRSGNDARPDSFVDVTASRRAECFDDVRRRLHALPAQLSAEIESPRGSFTKVRSDGRVDFVSPIPVPYNYGFVPGRTGGDGDPLDAIVLGPRLERGQRTHATVLGLVGFVDGGAVDDKVVLGTAPLELRWRLSLRGFFVAYTRFKRALALARNDDGQTRFVGLAVRR